MQATSNVCEPRAAREDDHDPERGRARDEQILLVADEGGAASVIRAVLVAHGYRVLRAAATEPDLFSRALGCSAIVLVPASNLLTAHLESGASAGAFDEVLRAARAPGVHLLVAALPEAPRFDPLVDAIARDGKPYVIARTPGLLEEVADTLRRGERTLWLPRTGQVHISRGAALADAIVNALQTDEQGRVVRVPSQSFDVAGLFAAAAGVAGAEVRVRPVAPLLYRMVRPVARWLKGAEPEPLAIADRLLASQQLTNRASLAATR